MGDQNTSKEEEKKIKEKLFAKKGKRNSKRHTRQQIMAQELQEGNSPRKEKQPLDSTEEKTSTTDREAQWRLKKYGFKIAGRKPKGLINETYIPLGPDDIRVRLRIMALNVGRYTSKKKNS